MPESTPAARDPDARSEGDAARGYLTAAVATLVALVTRVALDPVIGTRHRFALLYAATMLVASRHGLGPGLAVVLLGALGVAILSGLPALSSVTVLGIFTLDLGVYVATAGAMAWLAASMRRARRGADASATEVLVRSGALARSEERYRSFIEQSSEGIWRIELEEPVSIALSEDEQITRFYRYGYLAECNDAMARMYGFQEAAELRGARLDQLVVPADPGNREYLLAFIRGGYRVTDGESHERDRHGARKSFLNNLVGTVEHGHLVRAWGTQRDVSGLHQAEEALRASEERLRHALDAARMGIWDWDMVSGAIEWSDNLGRLHGLAPGTFRGTYDAYLLLVHPDDRATFTTAVDAAVASGAGYECEFRVVAADGTARWMLGKGQVFRDDAGAPVRMIGVGIDVTTRKVVEEELRRSVGRLERAEQDVQQLFILEREARADAERANRAKDEFLATLSHELRSPLSAALSWTHLLRRGQLDAEKTARALETIERTTRLQVRLVEDLLDISRIVSGKLTLEIGLVDLRAVIDAAVESARAAADARQMQLVVQPPAEMLLVAGDAQRVEQIMGNLLANAIKFTPAGGAVTIAWRRADGQVEVTVRDTGIGIAPDVMPQIFERFRQADGSTTRRHGGLGLGLAIVRYLVELHGGTIEAASDGEGKGTLMRFRLPLEVAAELGHSERHALRDPRDEAQLAGVRILIVDDETDLRDVVATALALHGAAITRAGSVDEALRCLPIAEPDVVVTDLAMPDRDGYALLRAVRATGTRVPVIALTALAGASDRQRALAVGFEAYLVKPVDPRVLVAAIARVRQGRPLQLSPPG